MGDVVQEMPFPGGFPVSLLKYIAQWAAAQFLSVR